MFNGLIREIGKVISFHNNLLSVSSSLDPKIGDSIAINGVCLSVTQKGKRFFSVQVSEETSKNVATENFKDKVHLEPAMKLGESIDGHLLQGHIDAIGVVSRIHTHPMGVDLYIKTPAHIQHLIVPKGSIAIDGVSLTVNEVFAQSLRLTLIPITFRETNFHTYTIGRKVNIETDIITRSIAHLYRHFSTQTNPKHTWEEINHILLSY